MAMPDSQIQLVRVFPLDDAEFVEHVHAALAIVGEAAGPEGLERRLRPSYPRVHVREQERLGMNGTHRPHWYVFRDGRIVPRT